MRILLPNRMINYLLLTAFVVIAAASITTPIATAVSDKFTVIAASIR